MNEVGVLAAFDDHRLFGDQTGFFVELAGACRERGVSMVAYGIGPGGSLHRLAHDGEGWRPAGKRPARVFYDRLAARPLPPDAVASAYVFNPPEARRLMSDKHVTAEALAGTPGVNVPRSLVIAGPDRLGELTGADVLVKPRIGQQGEGIRWLRPMPGGSWRDLGSGKVLTGTGMAERFRGWLIQRRVGSGDAPPVEARVLVQRSDGELAVTGGYGRRAGRSYEPGNLSRGAAVLPLEWVDGAPDVAATALAAVRRVEEVVGVEVFEAGVDVVLDDNGRPWVVEVNSRPARRGFTVVADMAREPEIRELYRQRRRTSVDRIAEYVVALAV